MTIATFAAGCFWGVQDAFEELDGVRSTVVGYTGGHTTSPTYEQVCSGRTGHAEAVRVEYDPQRISYEQLLEHFFAMHDPTTRNRQGPDIGTQYRSAVFHHDATQKKAAERMMKQLNDSGRFHAPIVTEITPAGEFWPAEAYHQHYFKQRGLAGGCH